MFNATRHNRLALTASIVASFSAMLLSSAVYAQGVVAPTGFSVPRIQPSGVGSSSVSTGTAGFSGVGGGGVGQVPKIKAERITVPSIGSVGGGGSLGGGIGAQSITAAPIIQGYGKRNTTRVPTTQTNEFKYNRYNRYGGTSQFYGPRVTHSTVAPTRGERVQRVQVMTPFIDGYESESGYSFAPDFSQDEFVWLPIGAR